MNVEAAWESAISKAKLLHTKIDIIDTPSNMRCAILDYRLFIYWDEANKKVTVRDSEFCEAEYIQTPQCGVLKVFKHTMTSRMGAGPGKEGLLDSQYNTLIPIKYSKIYIYANLAVLRSRDSSELFYLPTKDFIYSLDNWMNALMTYGDAKDINRYKNPIFYLVSEDISDDTTFTIFVADTINGKTACRSISLPGIAQDVEKSADNTKLICKTITGEETHTSEEIDLIDLISSAY